MKKTAKSQLYGQDWDWYREVGLFMNNCGMMEKLEEFIKEYVTTFERASDVPAIMRNMYEADVLFRTNFAGSMNAERYNIWWWEVMKCVLPIRQELMPECKLVVPEYSPTKLKMLLTEMGNGKVVALKYAAPKAKSKPTPDEKKQKKTKGKGKDKHAQASQEQQPDTAIVVHQPQPEVATVNTVNMSSDMMRAMKFPDDVNWIIDNACNMLTANGYSIESDMPHGVSAAIRAGLHLLLQGGDEVTYNGIAQGKWSRLKASIWKHLVTVSRTVVVERTQTPRQAAAQSQSPRSQSQSQSADLPDGARSEFDLLAAREFMVELGDDAMNLPVTFLGFVRLASNALKDEMRRTPVIAVHIRDVVKCVLKNVDSFLKPSLVNRVGSYLMREDTTNDDDDDATASGAAPIQTQITVLFPGKDDNAVDMDRALWFASLRAPVVYHLLHELCLDTPHAVQQTYSSHTEAFVLECGAKDSMYPSFKNRLTFWTSLWASLSSRVDALQALSTAHAVVTGVRAEPPAEVAEPEPGATSEIVEAESEPPAVPAHRASSTDFLCKSTAHTLGKSGIKVETLDDIRAVSALNYHVAYEAVNTALHHLDADCYVHTYNDTSTLRAVSMPAGFKFPFWGKVAFGPFVGKCEQRLQLGRVHGLDLYVVPDENGPPCAAWACRITQDSAEATVALRSMPFEVTLPRQSDEGAAKSVVLDMWFLEPLQAHIGKTDVCICRSQHDSDTNAKLPRKTVDNVVASLKRRLDAVYGQVVAEEPAAKVQRQRKDNIPKHLKHILM